MNVDYIVIRAMQFVSKAVLDFISCLAQKIHFASNFKSKCPAFRQGRSISKNLALLKILYRLSMKTRVDPEFRTLLWEYAFFP